MDEVDHVTDLATIALAFISGGVAPPALVVKFVAKLGKHRITGVLKKLGKDLAKVNKRKAGVWVSGKCLAGIATYPSFGIYT